MNVQDYLWYPYLRYQKKCREEGKEDSIQEWLELTGKVVPWKPPAKPKARTKSPAKPKKVVKKTTNPLEAALDKVTKRVRARNSKGHFIANDPATEENEAWVEKPSTKKRGRPKKKSK